MDVLLIPSTIFEGIDITARLIWSHKANLSSRGNKTDLNWLYKEIFPDFKKYKLGLIAEKLGIKVEVAHRALDDVETTVKVLSKMFEVLKEKKVKRLLLIATGALMNSTSSQQGESIPGIAHAVSIEI